MDITRIDRGSRRFIATKAFYLFVLSVAVPIMIQNGISNFVNMLDNLMIGRIVSPHSLRVLAYTFVSMNGSSPRSMICRYSLP